MSGLQIFNAHPHLYWGHRSDPGTALLSISSSEAPGDERGYVELFGQRIETTGLLGVQHTDTGTVHQAFPGWLTIPSYFWLAGGRHWHFFFGWIFFFNGMLYVIYNLLNGHMRKFFLTPCDAAKIPAMALYYLRLRKDSPQVGAYNPMQKMAYTGVFLLLTPVIMLSGMAMSPQLNQAFNWLPAMFGGRQAARTIHFLLTFAFAAFVFGPAPAAPPELVTISLNEAAPQPIVETAIQSEPREPGPQSPAGSGEATAESQKTGGKNDAA
jgi:thiosulfate reductase cytochrome b subunit